MKKNKLVIGAHYYMVQYERPNAQPEITTFIYRGTADGQRNTHIFIGSGMSETNIFLDSKDLESIIDFAALKL